MKRRIILSLIVITHLVGCASYPSPEDAQPTPGRYQSLYDGQPATVYGTQIPSESPGEAVAKGDQAARRGDLDMALWHYVQALEMNDSNADVFYRVGSLHERRDNHALAAVAYRLALRRKPNHVGANEGLGLELLRQRQYDRARDHLDRVVARDKNRWRAQNGLGILADLNGENGAAITHFKAALAAQPDSSMILNNLGYSLYLSGDLEGASQAFNRAATIDPRQGHARRNLGLVYARQGAYGEAVETLAATTERASALNDVGYLAMLNGDLEEAEYLLQEATLISPRYYVKAHENLARVDELRNTSFRSEPAAPPRARPALQLDDGGAGGSRASAD
jgi:Flp pilus assembly protein TadD